MIQTSTTTNLAKRDIAKYNALISSKGGSISDTELSKIQEFTEQVYSKLGRVDFWMLRSGQNVGTGTKIFSFHGLEGTLTNGPTWGVDGITFPAGSAVINLPAGFNPTIRAGFAVFKVTNNALHQDIFNFRNESAIYGRLHYFSKPEDFWETGPRFEYTRTTSRPVVNNQTQPVVINEFLSTNFDVGYDTDSGIGYDRICQNGTQIAYRSNLPGLNQPINPTGTIITRRFGGNNMKGTIAFVLTHPTNRALDWMHEVYKNTIGQGLDLP